MNKMKFIPAALLLLLAAATAWSSALQPAPTVKGIRVYGSGDDFGVEITADRDLVYSCTKIPPLLRVVIDLPLTEPGRPDTDYRVDSAMISTIRLEKKSINDDLVTRIAVNLIEDADYAARLDPLDRKKLTLTLHRNRPASPTAASAAAPERRGTAPPTQAMQPPSPPTASPSPGVPPVAATAARPVTVNGVSFAADSIDIQTGSSVGEFRAFTLHEPERLVIDIPAARSSLSAIAVPANRFGVAAARIGTFEGKLRLVFDAGRTPLPGYSIEKTGSGLRVTLKK